ncbi:saccharopine dehydrogenase C-terminal domain-containing protein [Tuberibacillus calidus]|jgi:lysine 6-dehydrogenase|uniref:saccharopine dehydrogenase C-terminal domain-containing protein n=1 Tax=Tuberibacillus calidus TaxID=340097 RepID=UPI000425B2A1|nr:saccharopine dehydrogenase C-terminal domain-containing protein [Tuberibacillus calidus]
MKVAVLGAGLMGKEAARDLAASQGVTQVVIADVDITKAEEVCRKLSSDKLSAAYLDATNDNQLADFMKDFDVVVNALFYTFNEKVARTAIACGVHSVDLGGHIGHVTEKVLAMHDDAVKAGVTLIPDLGVAPGMINILSGHGVNQLDQADSIKIMVGGIPVRPEPPFGYNHVFSMEGVFDHYTDPSLVIRDGKKMEVPSLSEIETVYFEKFGPLEAFHTAGGTSTLSLSYPNLKNLEYKTIRYPGHAEKFQLLVDLGLTKRGHVVEVDGQKVDVRKTMLKVLDPIVDLKDKDDVVLLRVSVSGTKDGQPKTYEYEMITYNDKTNRVTAMARSTAYTISVVAQMIASGVITKRGVYAPETIVPGEVYIQEMAKRGVIIKETEKAAV